MTSHLRATGIVEAGCFAHQHTPFLLTTSKPSERNRTTCSARHICLSCQLYDLQSPVYISASLLQHLHLIQAAQTQEFHEVGVINSGLLQCLNAQTSIC